MKVERRIFLKGMGSIAATAAVNMQALGQEQKISVGVVGGGIVGASITLHLSSAGARVTLFEKEEPAAGATSKSFAWINAFTTNPGGTDHCPQITIQGFRCSGVDQQ